MKRIARFAKSLSIVLFLAPPATTLAQELPSPGERVRVWGPVTSMDLVVNEKQETELSAIRGDTLVFEMPGSSVRVAVAQNRIRRLDVRRPRNPSNGAWLGTAAGFGIGVVAGLVLANARCDDSSCDFTVTMLSGGTGAGIGAIVGHAYPGNRWETVELNR